MPKKAMELKISESQTEILEKIKKSTHTEKHYIDRANIIIQAKQKNTNTKIAETLEIERNTVKLWRNRWAKHQTELDKVEKETPKKLENEIKTILSDEYRSGRKAKFTSEEKAMIVALSLQTPESQNVPISNWTDVELAKKAAELKIVDKISPRQVGRFLKISRNKSSSI